jgi:excisionase family DNA binding protein
MTTNSLSDLARSLTGALDDDGLRELAARLSPYLGDRAQSLGASRDDYLLTAADVAKRAGVNVETIRRAIRSGELDVAARIGRSPRISVLAVERWFAKTSSRRNGGSARGRRAPAARLAHQSLLSALMNRD